MNLSQPLPHKSAKFWNPRAPFNALAHCRREFQRGLQASSVSVTVDLLGRASSARLRVGEVRSLSPIAEGEAVNKSPEKQ